MSPSQAVMESFSGNLIDEAKLKRLGYVVIPVTPSGETIERMRGATNNAFENITNSGQRETMRAAYAAIVGGEG